MREVASAVTQAGVPISYAYIADLRNPGARRDGGSATLDLVRLGGLARFFGVPVTYFVADDTARDVLAQWELANELRALRVETVALREGIQSGQEATMEAIAKTLKKIRDLEQNAGLAEDTEPRQ